MCPFVRGMISRKARTCLVDRMRCAWVSGFDDKGDGARDGELVWLRKAEGATGGQAFAILQKGQLDEREAMIETVGRILDAEKKYGGRESLRRAGVQTGEPRFS